MAFIYCHGEAAKFPDVEFRRDSDGSLCIPPIHERGNPHYTSGIRVGPVVDPGIYRMADQLHGLALKMSVEELRNLLDEIQKRKKP